MARKLFGTDGIRGLANSDSMTPQVALQVGIAAGLVFKQGGQFERRRVVIGKDTRLSGYMIEPALVAGCTAAGMDVFLLGPIPTPGVAMLTRSLRADLGVMISASHNPYADNGIKLFGPDGTHVGGQMEPSTFGIVQQGGKNSGGIKVGKRHEIDGPVHADQGRRVKITNDPVMFNGLIAHNERQESQRGAAATGLRIGGPVLCGCVKGCTTLRERLPRRHSEMRTPLGTL